MTLDFNHENNFLGQVAAVLPVLTEAEEQLDHQIGRRFCAIDLFSPKEPMTSRLLAFLLNPRESHGQGDTFVRLFTARFLPQIGDAFRNKCARPERTHELIDITITDGRIWIGIENKIFGAPDQCGQVARYLNELRQKSNEYYLVYLSERGARPSITSLPEENEREHSGRLICGSWAQPDRSLSGVTSQTPAMVDWLSECGKNCRASNVKWFIDQFSVFVRRNVGGGTEEVMSEPIVRLALASNDNLAAALRIGKNFGTIKKAVWCNFLSELCDQLRSSATNNHWNIVTRWPGGDWSTTPCLKELPIMLRKTDWPNTVGIVLEADQSNSSGPFEVCVGVKCPTREAWFKHGEKYSKLYEPDPRFAGPQTRERMANQLGLDEPVADWWIWYNEDMDYNGTSIKDWGEESVICALHEHRQELAKRVAEEIKEKAKSLESVHISEI